MRVLGRNRLSRRTLLRGMMQGSALTMGLPWLEAMAAETSSGHGVTPLRMGTWFWGCGVTPGLWTPDVSEAGELMLKQESAPLEKVKQHLNFMTGFDAILDGKPNHVHVSGSFSVRSGIAPTKFGVMEGPTFETQIADKLGERSRFKTVDFTATGNPGDTISYRSATVRNTPETSAEALYQRLFGAGFHDASEGEFVPDPSTLRRMSVLSVVGEERKALERRLGTEDRQRLDQYFTSVREMEQQLEMQTVEPVRAEACEIPVIPDHPDANYDLANVHTNHEIMAKLLAMALVCDQTRSFNVVFSNSASSLHRSGEASSHHLYTHEEFTDADKGYQVETSKFVTENMKGFSKFVEVLANTPEADGTLLDNCLVFAHSDTSWAKIHAVQNIPMMTAGGAGGRVKTGQNIVANGDPITRVGLTLQQLAGIPIGEWGAGSLQTDVPVSQLLA